MEYLRYLKYVLRHKWFVMWECFWRGLFWRCLVHDNSKFLPDEFIPYANYFYGKKREKPIRDNTGYYKPTDTGDSAFDYAWLLHQKRNRHHWQWWILPCDEDGVKVLPIPDKYIDEMICDWKGAGKAQGTPDTVKWWTANKDKLQLNPETRKKIEFQMEGIARGQRLGYE